MDDAPSCPSQHGPPTIIGQRNSTSFLAAYVSRIINRDVLPGKEGPLPGPGPQDVLQCCTTSTATPDIAAWSWLTAAYLSFV
jgi:hypothetical protein